MVNAAEAPPAAAGFGAPGFKEPARIDEVHAEADGQHAQVEDVQARVDEVLAWLDAHGFVCDQRFAESRAHARSGRFGNVRIRQELAQHHVVLTAQAQQALAATEQGRAEGVRARKFSAPPATAAEAARQGRFLVARGFSGDVVRQVLRQAARRRSDPD